MADNTLAPLSPEAVGLSEPFYTAGIEWDAGTVINAVDYARRVLPATAKGFRELVSRFWRYKPVAQPPLPVDVKAFIRHADQLKYVNLSEIEVPVPQGMQVHYLDYIDAFAPSCNHAVDAWRRLCDYSMFIAKLVTLPEAQKETSGRTIGLAALEREREAINKAIGKTMKRNSLHATLPYGKVVSRNADWAEIVSEIEAQGGVIDSFKRSDYDRKVNELADNLERLANLQRQGKLDSITPEVVKDVAEGTYQLAAEVEFYAIAYYRYMALRQAVIDTINKVQKIS